MRPAAAEPEPEPARSCTCSMAIVPTTFLSFALAEQMW